MANLIFQSFVFHFPNQFLVQIPQFKTTNLQLKPPIFRQKRFIIVNSVSNVESLPVSDSVLSSSSFSSFTVKFLMNSCGLSLKAAVTVSQKFRLEENKSQHYESVLSLLRLYEFSGDHIRKVVIWFPQILKCRINNNLSPKLVYLKENGFVGPLLPELIAANPQILFTSLNGHIKPTIEILKKYIRTNERIVGAAKRCSWILQHNLKKDMQQNVEFLLSEGATINTIDNLIVWQPRAILVKFEKYKRAVKIVKKLGLNLGSSTCVEAVRLIASVSNSAWKKKFELFKSLGWSENEIVSAFARDPRCLTGSEEKIRSVMDFYVNTMKLNPSETTIYPKLFMFGLNSRIRPRYNVIKVLKSKNLIRAKKILWIFTISEKVFLRSYVYKNLEQVPYLMEIYLGTIRGDKIDIEARMKES